MNLHPHFPQWMLNLSLGLMNFTQLLMVTTLNLCSIPYSRTAFALQEENVIILGFTDSLMQDRENKETTEAIVETCMNQVTLLQENHGQAVSNIRNKAEQSLIKDYQVLKQS